MEEIIWNWGSTRPYRYNPKWWRKGKFGQSIVTLGLEIKWITWKAATHLDHARWHRQTRRLINSESTYSFFFGYMCVWWGVISTLVMVTVRFVGIRLTKHTTMAELLHRKTHSIRIHIRICFTKKMAAYLYFFSFRDLQEWEMHSGVKLHNSIFFEP
jgi:hypothetical protein